MMRFRIEESQDHRPSKLFMELPKATTIEAIEALLPGIIKKDQIIYS
jgi:hypothetical protein